MTMNPQAAVIRARPLRGARGRAFGLRYTHAAILLVCFVVASALVAAGFALVAGPIGLVAIAPVTAALLLIFVTVALPVHWLPAAALLLFAVLPLQLLPSDGVFNIARPATIVLAVWIVRRALRHGHDPDRATHRAELRFGGRFGVLIVAVLLVVWLAYTTWQSTASDTSTAWTASFVAGTVLPLLVFDARAEARALRRMFLWAGAALGAYAALEQILHFSPIYGTIAQLVGASGETRWAVYRSEASFGHPLFAGAFFVIPAALGIGGWLVGGPRRELVLGGVAAIGVVMTVSRSSILAVAVGATAAVAAAVISRRAGSGRRIAAVIALAVIAAIATAGFGPLEQRSTSVESGLSADVRAEALVVAVKAADVGGWLGTGPATSGDTARLFSTIVIENSLLQLLISVGIPGLVLFLMLFGGAAIEALRRHDAASFGAIVAYLTALTGFNSIDAVRGMHVLLGLLLMLALNGGTDTVPRSTGVFRPPTSRATPRPSDRPSPAEVSA